MLLFSSFSIVFYFWGSSKAYEIPSAETHQFQTSPDQASDTLRIVSYNVGYFSGMTNNLPVERSKEMYNTHMAQFHTLMDEIKPDILAVQEVDFNSDRSFNVNQYKEMGKSPYFKYGATAVNWNKTYIPYPYLSPTKHFGTILSGQAVLSRYPILKNERIVLSPPVDASFFYTAFYLERLAQVVEIQATKNIYVVNVHLEAFSDTTREVQAEELIKLIKPLKETHPVILIGDLNTVPIYTQDKKFISDENNDFTTEQTLYMLIKELELEEAYTAEMGVNNPRATYTYPSDDPQAKIDHIFYDPKKIIPISRTTIQKNASLSDHLPVVFTFKLL